MTENEGLKGAGIKTPVKKRRFFKPKLKADYDDRAKQAKIKQNVTREIKLPNPKLSPASPELIKELPKNTARATKKYVRSKNSRLSAEQQTAQELASTLKKSISKPAAAPITSKDTAARKLNGKLTPLHAEQKKQPVDAKKKYAASGHPVTKPRLQQLKNGAHTAHKAGLKAKRHADDTKLRLSDINFKYLDTPEFRNIYTLVEKAKSYFSKDKETCCAKFRIANEAIIARLIKQMQLTEAADKNSFEQINLLSTKIPENMVDSNIFSEMHNVRMIGNSFAHGDNKYDAYAGSRTCLIATEKICRWLVEFEPKYRSYMRLKKATPSSWTIIKNWFLSFFK